MRAAARELARLGRPLVISGHSAGGHLAACLLATDWPVIDASLPKETVIAAYAISGLFDLPPLVETSINKALGLDASSAKAASPLFWTAPSHGSLDAVVGEAESAEYHRQSRSIAEIWGAAGVSARYGVDRRCQSFHRDRAAVGSGFADGLAPEGAGRAVIPLDNARSALLRRDILSIKCLRIKRCRASDSGPGFGLGLSESEGRMSKNAQNLGPSGHVDDFARRNLPPPEQWPELLLDRPEFQYPDYLNAAVELTDRIVERGLGDSIALIGNGRQRTYKELADWSNRLAHALVENYGVKPGNRVLIRSGNNPALVAAWLAATKAGAVVVNTMPLLRAGELAKIVDKAEIALALTDSRIADELVACAKTSRFLKQVVNFDGTSNHDAELDRVALNKPVKFQAVKTGRDDVALLGFTSGTTGEPKATMHFHRDLLMIADGYGREVLKVTPDDVFVGSPPLAFTFGLGGLAIFPLRFGATATLLENAAPPEMIRIIETYKATVCFTSPTAYRAMMAAMDKGADLSSLRLAVSAGETLPAPVFEAWTRKTGKPILDGIGSTEMLHIFITNREGDAAAGVTGRPVTGYEARIVDDEMKELPAGTVGKLAVRGPTGCRYLADNRQHELCSRRLESHWRRLHARREGALLLCRACGRHDHLLRLQHRRPRGRSRAALASGGRRMRCGRRARRSARHDREGVCRGRGQRDRR